MELHFGTASVEITPPVGISLLGYSRSQPSQGVLDPLTATAMAFQNERMQFVMLSVDHMGLLVDQVQLIKKRIARETSLPLNHIMILFTHTHSGPDTDTSDTSDLTANYFNELVTKLIHVTAEAMREKHPCNVGWGVTHGDIGVNRRVHSPDGRVRMGTNPHGIVDKRIGAMKITHRETAALLGLVVICTAHANVLKGDSVLISADYPGWTRRLLQDALNCPVMIVIGAAGDCNARWRGSVADLDRMAQALSEHVMALLPNIQPEPLNTLNIRSTRVTIPLVNVPSPDEAETLAENASNAWDVNTGRWLHQIKMLYAQGKRQLSIEPEIQLVKINQGVLVGISMEPFAEIALQVAQRLNNDLCFLLGYTNGWIGYLPSNVEIPFGGYEIEWMPIVYGAESGFYMPVQPGAEEIVIQAVLNLCHEVDC